LDNPVSFSASAAGKLVRMRRLVLLLGRHPHLACSSLNPKQGLVGKRSGCHLSINEG
jgi:hypothetical protein